MADNITEENVIDLNGEMKSRRDKLAKLIADGKNVDIYITGNIIKTIRTPLKFFEKHEAFEDFIKINRNTIVNYDYIKTFDHNKIKMNNGINFDVSRTQNEDIKEKIFKIGVKRREIH